MPKKRLSTSILSPNNDLYRAAKYHWEFKRRNTAYREWWQQGLQETRKPEGWDARFNPDVSFDRLIEDAKATGYPGNAFSEGWADIILMMELLPRKGVSYGFDSRRLTIEIDFKEIRNISALINYVAKIIDFANLQDLIQQGLSIGRGEKVKPEKTKNLSTYKKILEAGVFYDELKRNRSRRPGIYRQIAKKFFPISDYPNYYDIYEKDMKRTPTIKKSALDEAERILKEYKRLVNGGYQEIVYP